MENKVKTPLTHRTWAKVLAFVLTIVMLGVAAASVAGVDVLVHERIYTTSQAEYRQGALAHMYSYDASLIVGLLAENREEDVRDFLGRSNIAFVEAVYSDRPSWHYANGDAEEAAYQRAFYYVKVNGGGYYAWDPEYGEEVIHTVNVTVKLAEDMQVLDDYYWIDLLVSVAYALRYWIFAIGGAAAIMAVACFVFLLSAAGWKKGETERKPGWGTKIPYDVLLFLMTCAVAAVLGVAEEVIRRHSGVVEVVGVIVAAVILCVMLLMFAMSTALRIKLGILWNGTILCCLVKLASKIPLVWKTALIFGGITLIDVYYFSRCRLVADAVWLMWILEHILLFAGVVYVALVLRKLLHASRAMAEGDLSAQVDTQGLVLEFKQAGENLNSIRNGMAIAVEERMKSERLKTELITNVSHDIKTPLTSIINYIDLIEREPCENEKIQEYTQVLHRQSERLKRLIEDLVEASKASTGNLEMDMAECELDVLLEQVRGEYHQRMADANLTLVATTAEEGLRILGDGRRLWRILDNLMNNACKYSMPGTRVYLSLEKRGTQAVIAIKNTSQQPLNLPVEELMERFVRGDESRNTEGNGLGLSIAQNLTELQKGKMQMLIDGDLFKVELQFPLL